LNIHLRGYIINALKYSAIGLVLTAMFIARYDRISKEMDFAEFHAYLSDNNMVNLETDLQERRLT